MLIKIKRIYHPPSADDGFRVLVDRLWPRNISREQAHLDLWLKEVALSSGLRKWYGHELNKWPEFKAEYWQELSAHTALLLPLLAQPKVSTITLLYAAKDEQHNKCRGAKRIP